MPSTQQGPPPTCSVSTLFSDRSQSSRPPRPGREGTLVGGTGCVSGGAHGKMETGGLSFTVSMNCRTAAADRGLGPETGDEGQMPSRHPVGLAAGGRTSSHLRPGGREGQELSRLPSGTRDLWQTGRPHVQEAGAGEDAQRPCGAAVGPGCPTPGTSVPGQDPRREVSPDKMTRAGVTAVKGRPPPPRPWPQGRGGRGRRDPVPFPAGGRGRAGVPPGRPPHQQAERRACVRGGAPGCVTGSYSQPRSLYGSGSVPGSWRSMLGSELNGEAQNSRKVGRHPLRGRPEAPAPGESGQGQLAAHPPIRAEGRPRSGGPAAPSALSVRGGGGSTLAGGPVGQRGGGGHGLPPPQAGSPPCLPRPHSRSS